MVLLPHVGQVMVPLLSPMMLPSHKVPASPQPDKKIVPLLPDRADVRPPLPYRRACVTHCRVVFRESGGTPLMGENAVPSVPNAASDHMSSRAERTE